MSDATLIAIFLMIPMALLTVAQIGMLRSRMVFAIVGFFVMIITCGLLLAASFAHRWLRDAVAVVPEVGKDGGPSLCVLASDFYFLSWVL